MGDSYQFTVDVFRTVCDRLRVKVDDLHLLVESGALFKEWLNWEAFLACKYRQATYPFCEVTAKPTYASEGVVDDGDHTGDRGDLRVGGPDDGADHCWVFAEFVLLTGGDRDRDVGPRDIASAADRLKRLGWKRSASLLVVVAAKPGDVSTGWADYLTGLDAWNRPALTDPFVATLPGGGSVALKAFDIKRNPADTLTAETH